MKHLTDEQVIRYMHNQLSEAERIAFEDHVYDCDPCLQRLIQWMDAMVEEFPDSVPEKTERIGDALPSDPYIDAIMAQLSTKHEPKIRKRNSYLQQPVFHYVVAASITLLLMGSGVFQQVSGWLSAVNAAPVKQESSISEQMMNKALSWIELLESKAKEGER